jgi:hypothetical protein
LHFAIDDNHVLNIGRDADFCGLNREFGLNDVVLGNVPEPKIVYFPELASSVSEVQRPWEGGRTESQETRNAESADEVK